MVTVKAVTSRDNPLLVRIRKLVADPSGYRKHGEIWLEGDHLCAALLERGGTPSRALVTEAAWEVPRLQELASRADSVTVVPPALMASLSALESAPAMGFVAPWKGPGTVQPRRSTVVLDRLQDAGNVGTILRTASAFGVQQVIALQGTAALWSPKVLRAAMGAHFNLELVEGAAPEELDLLDVPLVATSSHARSTVFEVALPQPCAWLLGHEGQGVAAPLLVRCALTVAIPQPGGEESLNVATAAAVCLYEAMRQSATAS